MFAPDVIAVLDVDDLGDEDPRNAWVVADEGKGLDWVLEVMNLGDRRKDLVENVLDYAALGIFEYFVYDRLRGRLVGHRLPGPNATRYNLIPSRGGVLQSRVLGLDLTVMGSKLRFLSGGALVPEMQELLERANNIADHLENRAEEADQAREAAEQRALEANKAREAAERRAEVEAVARATLEARVAELLARQGG